MANRALKDYGQEQLPFKRFNPNAAWYYSMVLAHFLMEMFKVDVGSPVVPIGAYVTTVRRQLIDMAGKIVSHGGKIVLKVQKSCFKVFSDSFDRCRVAPQVQWTSAKK